MSIVKGFSGLIHPANLATNGSFKINQRGWPGTPTRAKVGDFPTDAWVITTTPSELSVVYDSNGSLNFSGKCTKGQQLIVHSMDTQPYAGGGYGANIRQPITAVMDVYNQVASVPIQILPGPRFHTNGFSNSLNVSPVLSVGCSGRGIQILNTLTYVVQYGASINVTFLESGEFSFVVQHFAEMVGAYQNPPSILPVPYAEDIARCQRYYQTGHVALYALGGSDGTSYSITTSETFATKMAGTPSVAISGLVVQEEGAATNAQASYTIAAQAVTAAGFNANANKLVAGSKPNYLALDYVASV